MITLDPSGENEWAVLGPLIRVVPEDDDEEDEESFTV